MAAIEHETTQKIARLVRARYPIIAVVSHEEDRVQGHIIEIAKAQEKTLYTWTLTQGLQIAHPEPDEENQLDGSETRDPVAALREVLAIGKPTDPDIPAGPPAIFLFKDLHSYLGEHQDPVVVRALRDVAATLIKRFQTVILLSPAFRSPLDTEKDIVVVDFPLPTAGELGKAIDQFVESLPGSVPCNLNGGREQIVRALQGLTATEADAVLAQAVIANGHLDTDAIPFILTQKAEIIRASGALEYYSEQASYNDIGGLDLLKDWCKETEVAFSDAAVSYGVESEKGVLIVGIPGCGKSLTAKAVAGGVRPLLRLDVGALFGSLVGQSEAQARNALKVAEAVAPCVLWIDEVEKALGSGGGELDGGTSKRVLGTILTWMQETKAPIFIVATANDIASLRPELIRRFGEVFFVDLPQTKEREDILKIHLKRRNRKAGDFNVKKVTKATENFTGSEIEKVVQGSLRRAFADDGREMTTDDLLAQAGTMVPLSTTMAEGIAAMRQWSVRARPASSEQRSGHKIEQAKGRAIEI